MRSIDAAPGLYVWVKKYNGESAARIVRTTIIRNSTWIEVEQPAHGGTRTSTFRPQMVRLADDAQEAFDRAVKTYAADDEEIAYLERLLNDQPERFAERLAAHRAGSREIERQIAALRAEQRAHDAKGRNLLRVEDLRRHTEYLAERAARRAS